MTSQSLAAIIASSPLEQKDKDKLLTAIKDQGETDAVIMAFQLQLTALVDGVVNKFAELEDPKIQALANQAKQASQVADEKFAATLQRLATDAQDLTADAQRYQEDLVKAIEDTKKLNQAN